jgi:hypothetical protein
VEKCQRPLKLALTGGTALSGILIARPQNRFVTYLQGIKPLSYLNRGRSEFWCTLFQEGWEMARRRRESLTTTRSLLYALARLLGDVEAAKRGPEALGKRILRRALGKATGRAMSRFFR